MTEIRVYEKKIDSINATTIDKKLSLNDPNELRAKLINYNHLTQEVIAVNIYYFDENDEIMWKKLFEKYRDGRINIYIGRFGNMFSFQNFVYPYLCNRASNFSLYFDCLEGDSNNVEKNLKFEYYSLNANAGFIFLNYVSTHEAEKVIYDYLKDPNEQNLNDFRKYVRKF